MSRYKIEIICNNCDYIGEISLPKKTPVSNNMECPNCGCKTASKKTSVPILPLPHKKDLPWYPWPPVKYETTDKFLKPNYPFDVSCEFIPLNTDLHGKW